MSPDDLREQLHRSIPLSVALAVEVRDCSLDRVALAAPLEPNLNHLGTAFGGSVASLAMLAGWSLVHMRMVEQGIPGETVIQRAAIEYDAPAHGPLLAVCETADRHAWSRLHRALDRRRRGRVRLSVRVDGGGTHVASLDAAYVVSLA